MVRRSNHAFHDLGSTQPATSPDSPNQDAHMDNTYVDLPDMVQINQRLAGLRAPSAPTAATPYNGSTAPPNQPQPRKYTKGKYLVDQIPSDALPSTLSIGGHAREPVPEIPTERELSQLAIDGSNKGIFRTFEDACPPPADTLYEVVDQGMSGPRSFRVSMYNIPFSAKLRESSQLPLVLFVRPFADHEVPLADFSEFSGAEMPPRCVRCRAYMNPSMRFVEGGARFVCNLCLFVNTTPDEYYQPLTPEGKRIDWSERPELAYGTYEFEVAPPYGAATSSKLDSEGNDTIHSGIPNPQYAGTPLMGPGAHSSHADGPNIYGDSSLPMKRVFCCECTREAVQKGVLAAFVSAVRETCSQLGPEEKVAIVLFSDKVYHFRKLGDTTRIQMLVANPDESAVVPPDVFYTPNGDEKSSQAFSNLMDSIPTLFASSNAQHNCLGSAISSSLDMLKPAGGGRVTTTFCTLPSLNPGALSTRDISIPGVTADDAPVNHQLFAATNKFYLELASRAQHEGSGLDLLAVPTSRYLDMATLAVLPQRSGGRLFYHPRFVFDRDYSTIAEDLMGLVQPTQARAASLRIRCSTGLQVSLIDQYAAHVPKGSDNFQSFMDENTTVVAELRHDASLDPKLDAHFQTAVLYTAPDGSKRVRVLNLLAGVATKIKAVLKFVDIDSILAVLVRQTLAQIDQHSSQELREAVCNKVMDIFGAARLHAGQGMPLSQLLMPTNLRELIMMGLSLTKSVSLGVRGYSIDSRVADAVWLSQATPEQLSLSLYPRIHDIVGYAELLDKLEGENSKEPQTEAQASISRSLGTLSIGLRARMTDLLLGSQAHLIYNGQKFFLWLGTAVSRDVLEQLFGVGHLEELNPYIDSLPVIDTKLNEAARQLCTALSARTGRDWSPLQIVREKLDGAEYQVRQLMVEDAYGNSAQYSNFVMKVHEHAKTYKEHSGWF